MMQTINPYASARTAEIMSRYRPIAPKPESPSPNNIPADNNDAAAVPTGIRKSPYLRNVWAHLQARPTRTRKRGRTAAFGPPPVKRARACLQGLISPPYHQALGASPARSLAVHGFVPIKCCLDTAVTTLAESVALPLLCCAAAAAQTPVAGEGKEKGIIDLNLEAEDLETPSPARPAVISPRPVRPVGSRVLVERISDDPRRTTVAKGAAEVEEMVEAEEAPAIVSDSNNKVRMCNSAYKELVGQPQCGWLDCAAASGGGRRIGGEVSIRFSDSKAQMMCVHGFNCGVKIEWESEGVKKRVSAYCEGVKLACGDKDYQFFLEVLWD